MTEELYPKLNLKILARVFKMLRVQKGYSLRGIADAANLSHVVISDIENGRTYPNLDTLVALFRHAGVYFTIDDVFLLENKRHIELFNEALYYENQEAIEFHYDEVFKNHDKLFYSLLLADYTLAEITYKVIHKKVYDFEELQRFEDFYDYLSEDQKHRFNLIYGVTYLRREDPVKAVIYLERNLNLFGNKKAYALTLSYLSFAYNALYQTSNTIHYASEASELHAEFANFSRKVKADLLIARMFLEIGRYQKSQQIISSIELTVDGEIYNGILNETRFLKSYHYYRKKDYIEALKVFQKFPFRTRYVYFYEAMLHVRLNDIPTALQVLERSIKDSIVIEDYIYSRVCRVALYYFSGDFDASDYESTIIEIFNNRFKLHDIQVFRLVFEMLVNYYEHHKEYKKAFNTAKKFIQWTGRTTFIETNN